MVGVASFESLAASLCVQGRLFPDHCLLLKTWTRNIVGASLVVGQAPVCMGIVYYVDIMGLATCRWPELTKQEEWAWEKGVHQHNLVTSCVE